MDALYSLYSEVGRLTEAGVLASPPLAANHEVVLKRRPSGLLKAEQQLLEASTRLAASTREGVERRWAVGIIESTRFD